MWGIDKESGPWGVTWGSKSSRWPFLLWCCLFLSASWLPWGEHLCSTVSSAQQCSHHSLKSTEPQPWTEACETMSQSKCSLFLRAVCLSVFIPAVESCSAHQAFTVNGGRARFTAHVLWDQCRALFMSMNWLTVTEPKNLINMVMVTMFCVALPVIGPIKIAF